MSESMSELSERISNLDPASLAEVAEAVVADVVGIDDPTSASARVAELANLPPLAASELQILADEASQQSLDEFAPLMRTVLIDILNSDLSRQNTIAGAVESTGRKQIVIGPEVWPAVQTDVPARS